jgi:hypothetical protein
MREAMYKTMKHPAVNFALRRGLSHASVLLKGTASAVPQHPIPARGALAPEVTFAEARCGW